MIIFREKDMSKKKRVWKIRGAALFSVHDCETPWLSVGLKELCTRYDGQVSMGRFSESKRFLL
jgi:hypothetical protein